MAGIAAASCGGVVVMESQFDPLRSTAEPSRLKATLEERDLWEKFHEQTNEMIVTKSGRRMFPVIKVNLGRLDHGSFYTVLLEFKQIGTNRWKYINGEWLPGGKSEPAPRHATYVHPDSPNYGSHWEKEAVSFQKVKLTNKPCNGKDKIMLNSLHKYEPQVHVFKVDGANPTMKTLVLTIPYPTTQFIAVTAYQNEDVTALKIRHNPFAKAFQQDSSKARGSSRDLDQSMIGSAYQRAVRHVPYPLPASRRTAPEDDRFGGGHVVKQEPFLLGGEANWTNHNYAHSGGLIWNGVGNQGFSSYSAFGASPQVSPANSSTATTSSFGSSENQSQFYPCQTSPSTGSNESRYQLQRRSVDPFHGGAQPPQQQQQQQHYEAASSAGGLLHMPTPPDDPNDRHLQCKPENPSPPNLCAFPDYFSPQPVVLEVRENAPWPNVHAQDFFPPNPFNSL